MIKKTSLAEQFRERRAMFSTRISSRGHGFEQMVWNELHAPIIKQIPIMIQKLKELEPCIKENKEAECQVNRLRGQLGNLRQIFNNPEMFSLANIFMTIAMHELPQEAFDAILTDARWIREIGSQTLSELIEKETGIRNKSQKIENKHKLMTFRTAI